MNLLMSLVLIIGFFIYIGDGMYRIFYKYLFWNKLKFPLGFITTLGVIQLVSFPVTYLHLSMKKTSIIYLITLVLLFLCITLGRIRCITHKNEKMKKESLFEYLFYGTFILFFCGLYIVLMLITNSLNVASSDQSFYITAVENNINASHINMITPLTGEFSPQHLYYNFQSYLVFLSFISQLFNIPSVLISIWGTPIILLLLILTSILNACSYFGVDNKKWIISMFIISFTFNFWPIESIVKYGMCIGYLRCYLFIFIIILYYEFFSNSKINYVFINLVWLAAIAVQSTALFNGYLFIGALILYDILVVKKRVIFELFKSSFGLHIYLFFFLRYSWHYKISTGGLILLLIGLLIDNLPSVKEWVLNLIYSDNMKKIIFITYGGLILLILIAFNYNYIAVPISSSYFVEYLSDYYFNNNYYSFVGFSLIDTFLKLSLIGMNIFALLKIKNLNNPMKFFIYIQIIFIIFFYNPLVAPFISGFITGSVYFRLREVIYFVPFTIVSILFIKDNLKHSKKIIIGLTLMCMIHNGMSIYEYLTFDYNRIPNYTRYNYMYRLPEDTVSVAQFLDSYIRETTSVNHENDDVPLVYSTNRQINYFSHNYKMFYTIHEERNLKNINLDESIRLLDKYAFEQFVVNSKLYEQKLHNYPRMLLKYKLDFIVLENTVTDEIKSLTERYYYKIYENPTFVIYELKSR